jgi:hypothetical protein
VALAQVKLDPGEHAPLLASGLDIPSSRRALRRLAPEELCAGASSRRSRHGFSPAALFCRFA